MTEVTIQGREIGYASVSKTEQHLALQLDSLKKRGVIRIFTDKQTGTCFDRAKFYDLLLYLFFQIEDDTSKHNVATF